MRTSLRFLGLACVIAAVGCDDDGAPAPNDLGADLATPTDLARPPDLTTPPDLAPACTKAATGPLSIYRTMAMPIGSMTTPFTVTVPDGHRAHGTITLAGTLSGGRTVRGGTVALVAADGTTYDATIGAPSGQTLSYDITVPSGLYTVKAAMTLDPGASIIARAQSATPVNVCGDTTADLTIPALPTLVAKRVRAQGFGAVDPQPSTVTLILERADGSLVFTQPGAVVAATSSNVWEFDQMALPEGESLRASFNLVRAPNSSNGARAGGYDVVIRSETALTVANTLDPFGGNITLPPTVKLSGTINDPSTTLFPVLGDAFNFYHVVHCDPTLDVRLNQASYGSAFTDATAYALPVRSGVSCAVYGSFAIPLTSPADATAIGLLNQPKAPALETIAAATTRNFTVPALTTPVAVDITVSGTGGPLANAAVQFESTTLVAAAATDAKVTAFGATNASGVVSAKVQPGTYTILVTRQ